LFLRGGRVIDPARGIDARFDVLVRDGRIAELRPPDGATPVEDVDVRDITGCVVTPGLVDLHGHWYDGSAYGIDPAVSLRSGVTTAVDAGTAGFVNFASFRRQSIDSAPLRVLAFLNIAALGIPTTLTGELDTPDHIRPGETAETIRAHADVTVGVKVRLSAAVETGGAPAALDRALEAARAVDRPVMVDVGGAGDFMPDALDRLGPGDILTHCFTGGGATIIDDAGRVRREAIDARARGVIFDVGHGCGSFSWRSARAALGQGFAPDSISSDLHRYSVDKAGVDLNTMMTKFLALGLDLADVVARVTVAPARQIGRPEPTLAPGDVADIAVFRIDDAEVSLRDSQGEVEIGRRSVVPVLTVVGGRPIDPASVQVSLRPFLGIDATMTCGGVPLG
jgi:dihydroorotase